MYGHKDGSYLKVGLIIFIKQCSEGELHETD